MDWRLILWIVATFFIRGRRCINTVLFERNRSIFWCFNVDYYFFVVWIIIMNGPIQRPSPPEPCLVNKVLELCNILATTRNVCAEPPKRHVTGPFRYFWDNFFLFAIMGIRLLSGLQRQIKSSHYWRGWIKGPPRLERSCTFTNWVAGTLLGKELYIYINIEKRSVRVEDSQNKHLLPRVSNSIEGLMTEIILVLTALLHTHHCNRATRLVEKIVERYWLWILHWLYFKR